MPLVLPLSPPAPGLLADDEDRTVATKEGLGGGHAFSSLAAAGETSEGFDAHSQRFLLGLREQLVELLFLSSNSTFSSSSSSSSSSCLCFHLRRLPHDVSPLQGGDIDLEQRV